MGSRSASRERALKPVEITSIGELRAWLEANHGQSESIWLVTYKKQVADKYVAYDEIVDEALCFGWIDSLPRKMDGDRTMLRLSPRKPGSAWSKANKERIARLEKAGRLRPAALEKIAAAKANGLWSFLDDVDALIKPDDLIAALAAQPLARKNFDAFAPSAQRGILEWIKQAKRPATRAKRIAETARLAAQNIKANFPQGR